MDKVRSLGIIHHPGFGCRDFPGTVGLWFTVYTSESSASLQCFFGKEATDIIYEYGVYDVKDLDGKPCWVNNEGALVRWIGPCKMAK